VALDYGSFSVEVTLAGLNLDPFGTPDSIEPESSPRPTPAPGLPNILVIQCDDLGYGDIGLTGNTIIDTPVIDNLRTQGAFFPNYYSAANICSPTRAAMLTGRMPYRLGVYSFIRDAEDYVHLDHSETTIPQALQKVGYQCANIGKWHVSHLDAIEPEDLPTMRYYGFDYWLSSDNNLKINNKPDWWRNETQVGTISGYAGTVVSDEIIDWLANSRDPARPFMLFANYYEPHADSDAPQALKDKYTGLGHASGPARYYACVEHLDTQIGRMLAALDTYPELASNTLVLFTSDHGPNPSSTSQYGTAAPYRGTKYQVWDGSTHVPAIIRWPGHVATNSTISETIGSIDLFQTLASICGAEEYLPTDRPLDGTDYSSLLTGEGTFSRTTPLQWHYYKSSASSLDAGSPQAALRVGDLVIAGFYDSPFSFGNVRWMPIPSQNNGIIEMDYITGTGTEAGRTLSISNGTFRLYDISTDQHQDTDIYSPGNPVHTALRDQLITYHQALQAQAPGWGFRTDAPDYSSYTAWRAAYWDAPDVTNDAISGPNADPDGDNRANYFEFAVATDPTQSGPESEQESLGFQEFDTGSGPATYPGFAFNVSPDSTAKLYAETSSNLVSGSWNADPGQQVLYERIRNTDGTYRVFYRSADPIGQGGKTSEFLRLRADP